MPCCCSSTAPTLVVTDKTDIDAEDELAEKISAKARIVNKLTEFNFFNLWPPFEHSNQSINCLLFKRKRPTLSVKCDFHAI